MPGPQARDPRDFFEASHIPEPNSGCWLWEGLLRDDGYGLLPTRKTMVRAHRFSLQMATGRSGDGFDACHSCNFPPCVNPDHLFWGDREDNMADAAKKGRMHNRFNKSKTHCSKGHEFTPENTQFTAKGRACRACARVASKALYDRKKGISK